MENYIASTLSGVYQTFIDQVPDKLEPIIILALFSLLITVYAIIVWKFYKFLARRNIIQFNLNQYNRTEHPFWNKLLASVFFLVEYIIIVPIIVFVWFGVLAIFLLILSKSPNVSHIILVSAAIVAAIRISSYFSTDLSKDLAKIFPFTALAIFILEPGFFDPIKLIERISEIPSLLGQILIYLIFIIVVELILRSLFTLVDLFSSGENVQENQN